jgi:lipopolysaccharide export LptBFGC system permease protein LptF
MAFLSALVYSAFSFANVAFLFPDMFSEQMDMLMQQMEPMLDSNTTSEIEKKLQTKLKLYTN